MDGEQTSTAASKASLHTRTSLLLLKAMPHMLQRASSEWVNDNVPRLGASVAFYTLLSLAPVVIIAVAMAAIVYGREAAQGRLAVEMRGIAGPDVTRTIQEILALQPPQN